MEAYYLLLSAVVLIFSYYKDFSQFLPQLDFPFLDWHITLRWLDTHGFLMIPLFVGGFHHFQSFDVHSGAASISVQITPCF